MIHKAILCLTILVQVSIQAFGLNIDQLHKEVFPYNSRNTDSKRQYVYGRVVNPSKQANQNSGPPFEMNTMFSSAMGSKLKRLVSSIDDKMQNEDSEVKKADGDDVHPMMMKKKRNESPQNRVFDHDMQGKPDDKRFVGLNEQGLQKISTRSENNGQISNDEADVNGPGTVWMDGENDVFRLPPDVDRRQDSQRIFRQHNGFMKDLKKPDENYWFDRQPSGEPSTADKELPGEMEKKDAETVDDFQFFKDDGEVMKELKRVFDDDEGGEHEGASPKKKEKSEESAKSEEQRRMDEKHEELMDEYMKYIAQATSIKKRSPVPIHKEEQWYEMNQAENINERLKEIERIILDEANEIMREERPMNPNELESEVMNRVRAANDLDNIRNSILDLQDIMYEIRSEELPPNDVYVAEKRGNKLANALNIMAPSDRKRSDQEFQNYNEDDCPDEQLYGRDCSLLTNFLPEGGYKKYFRSACFAHQLCYICMDVYGTTASECDSGFLEDSYRICENNRPCRTATKTMVLSNRKKRQTITNGIDNCDLKLCQRNKHNVKRSTDK